MIPRRRRSSTSGTTGPRTSSGAAAAGWRTAWVRERPADSPLHRASRTTIRADLELRPLPSWRPGSLLLGSRRSRPDRAFTRYRSLAGAGARMHRRGRGRQPLGHWRTHGRRHAAGESARRPLDRRRVAMHGARRGRRSRRPVVDPARRSSSRRSRRSRHGTGATRIRLVADGRVRPDVLLTDIAMPGMSGVELAARLRALCPGLGCDDDRRPVQRRDRAGPRDDRRHRCC